MDNKQKTISNKRDSVRDATERYAHAVYTLARLLPKDELFGLTSQLRRAALSVPLNVVEGYARRSAKSEAQFLKIAYGSLKEAQFTLQFARDEAYLTDQQIEPVLQLGEESARLIWAKAKSLEKKLS